MGDPHLRPAEWDFVAARRRLESKPTSAGDKLTSLEDAAARVADGDRIAVGGCLFSRTPMALVREILRARRTGLTLVRNLMCTEGEFMMSAGAVSRVMTAWMSIGLPWGVSKIMRHYVESGAVALEEWSHLALGLRFRVYAAAPWPEGSRLVYESETDWGEAFHETARRGVWWEVGARWELPGSEAGVGTPELGREAARIFRELEPLLD